MLKWRTVKFEGQNFTRIWEVRKRWMSKSKFHFEDNFDFGTKYLKFGKNIQTLLRFGEAKFTTSYFQQMTFLFKITKIIHTTLRK